MNSLALLAVLAAPWPAHTSASAMADCQFPTAVQSVTFSVTKYPEIHRHYLDALAAGWPKVLIIARDGASERRTTLLKTWPTRSGMDRDEYPPAAAREGWLADVEYVDSSENRSQGTSLGNQLRGLCDGVRFQYRWTS